MFDNFGNLFIAYLEDLDDARVLTLAMSVNGGQTFPTRWHLAGDFLGSGDQPTVVVGPGSKVNATDPYPSPGSVWVTYANRLSASAEHWQIAARGAPAYGLDDVGAFTDEQTVALTRSAPPDNQVLWYQHYGDIAIGPDGEVLVTYQEPDHAETENGICVSLDPDGLCPTQGFHVDLEQQVASTNVGAVDLIRAHPNNGIDAEAGLAWDLKSGRVYLMYLDEPEDESDNTDVYVKYLDNIAYLTDSNPSTGWSTAYLASFEWSGGSTPVKVQAAGSQFMPKIAIDQDTGLIGLSWYDCRDDSSNLGAHFYATVGWFAPASGTLPDRLEFLDNVSVSDGTSHPRESDPSDYYDYTALAFFGGSLYPCWADNSVTSDGTYDLYTARVTVTSGTTGATLNLVGDDAGTSIINDHFILTLDPSGTYVQIWQTPFDPANPDAIPALPARPTFTATLASLASITLDAKTGTDRVTLLASAGTTNALALTADTLSSGPLTVSHAAGALEQRAFRLTGGSHSLATDNGSWTPLSITLTNAACLTFASNQYLGALALGDSATAQITDTSSTQYTLSVGSLSIGTAASLDISRSRLDVRSPGSGALADLATFHSDHRITSSMLLANIANTILLGFYNPNTGLATFRYTLIGDATGDQTIDLDDLNAVLNNFGGTAVLQFSDTDGDGDVDLQDLNNVLNNFGSHL